MEWAYRADYTAEKMKGTAFFMARNSSLGKV
jgi:hypothetical protein